MILTPHPDTGMPLEGHNLKGGITIEEAFFIYVQRAWDNEDKRIHYAKKGMNTRLIEKMRDRHYAKAEGLPKI